ncbi:hypothetical protein BE20_03845 [Sorangium cellulosum]|nr:hypothetical protein BE20_03845 [Sorangium cellulosum]
MPHSSKRRAKFARLNSRNGGWSVPLGGRMSARKLVGPPRVPKTAPVSGSRQTESLGSMTRPM